MKAHLRKINTAIIQLVMAFIIGILLGTLSAAQTGPIQLSSAEPGTIGLAPLLWLSLLVLLCGTSTLGHYLIPILALVRGYILSASFAILLCCGIEAKSALLVVGIPAVFSVPAFFLLCEDALSVSRIIRLCSECSLTRNCGYIQPQRLLLAIILLLTAAALQIYFQPLIV